MPENLLLVVSTAETHKEASVCDERKFMRSEPLQLRIDEGKGAR